MRTESIAGLLAEPERLRAFSAVVLGAEDVPEVARAAGLTPQQAATALGRLREGGLVEGGEWHLRACGERFKDAVRASAPSRPSTAPEPLERFVRDGRLVSLPHKFTKRGVVLRHLADASFDAGRSYGEKAVDEVLREWCRDAEADHVSVRRYLVDHGVMAREGGQYRLRPDVPA